MYNLNHLNKDKSRFKPSLSFKYFILNHDNTVLHRPVLWQYNHSFLPRYISRHGGVFRKQVKGLHWVCFPRYKQRAVSLFRGKFNSHPSDWLVSHWTKTRSNHLGNCHGRLLWTLTFPWLCNTVDWLSMIDAFLTTYTLPWLGSLGIQVRTAVLRLNLKGQSESKNSCNEKSQETVFHDHSINYRENGYNQFTQRFLGSFAWTMNAMIG